MKCLTKGLIPLMMSAGLLTSSAGEGQVLMKIGKKAPVPIAMPGGVPLPLLAGAPAPVTIFTLPNYEPVTFSAPAGVPLSARVWNKVRTGPPQECDPIAPSSGNELIFDVADVNCPGFLLNELEVELDAGGAKATFTVPNKNSVETGDNIGIQLTAVDRWEETDADGNNVRNGARVNGGAGIYYSISNLKNDHVGLIGNVSVLDQDPDLDFELGVGLGFLFKFQRLGEDNGFGMAAGVGYNLMLDNPDERWYTFVGFSMDFGLGGDE